MVSQKFSCLGVSVDKMPYALKALSKSHMNPNSSPKQYHNLPETTRTTNFTFAQLQNLVPTRQFLSRLLPYNPSEKTGNRLRDGLKEYLLLLIAVEQAMDSLQQGELKNFDPLVGENACQIRAVKIALIIRNRSVNVDSILHNIKDAKINIESFLCRISNFANLEMSLKDYLETEKIDIVLNEDEIFLIKSFILTKTKVVQPFFKLDKPLVENAYSDSKKIKEISEVGSSFSGDLVKKLRKKLSASSVSFVQELAVESDSLTPGEKLLFSNQFVIIHNGLMCLPYYRATWVLMKQALSNNIPIALLAQQIAKDQDYKIIQKTAIFFQATPQGYQEISRDLLDPEMPALTLIGSTCRDFIKLPTKEDWTQELLAQSPIDLVLAYAAAHRQYPDDSKDQLLLEILDEDYEYHKVKAQEWGCSLENPSRFFLTHAFCDKIKNIDCHI